MHLRRKCILLLLSGIFYQYQLSLSDLLCQLEIDLNSLIYFLSGRCARWFSWSVAVLHCHCVGLPRGSDGKESALNTEDLGSDHGSRGFP